MSVFSLLDWVVLAVYFAATLALGGVFARRSNSVEGFTRASGSLPGWVCGLSIFATYLSSISYLALPGKSFAANWNPFVYSLAIPVAAWIAVAVFVPYYRRGESVSAYASLEQRFGTWARVSVSVLYLLTQIARMGVVMYLMALTMQMLLGWDIRTLIVITGVVVTLYAMVGGIAAVIWADAIQAIVLMTGAVVCLATMVWMLPGGVGTVFEQARADAKFSLGSTSLSDFASPTIAVVLLYGLVENLKNFGIDQSYVQRYLAADSDRAARGSLWLGAILYVPISALFFFIGTTLFAYHQTHPGELEAVTTIVAEQKLATDGVDATPEAVAKRAATLAPADYGDSVFPHFIVTQMPPGLRGLLIAAVFAAAMSTVSTSLNSSATLVLEDYVRRFFVPDLSDAKSVWVLRIMTAVWGVLGTATAIVLVATTNSALDTWWTLSGIFGGAMVGLFLLGIFTRTATQAAAIATAVGIAVITAVTFSPDTVHKLLAPVVGTLAILGVGILLQKLLGGGGGGGGGANESTIETSTDTPHD